jgi:hypothetical protein
VVELQRLGPKVHVVELGGAASGSAGERLAQRRR